MRALRACDGCTGRQQTLSFSSHHLHLLVDSQSRMTSRHTSSEPTTSRSSWRSRSREGCQPTTSSAVDTGILTLVLCFKSVCIATTSSKEEGLALSSSLTRSINLIGQLNKIPDHTTRRALQPCRVQPLEASCNGQFLSVDLLMMMLIMFKYIGWS